MTSQIVFMEHSPITMLKRANSPQSLGNFLYSVCNYPHHSREREDLRYSPNFEENSLQGSFHMTIMTGQVEFKGKFFREQAYVNQYLLDRGIAIKLGLVDMREIRNRAGSGSGILFIEEIKYSGATLGSMAVSRAKALLKIPASTTGHHDLDTQFLGVKAGKLIHTRSGDLIPPDEWVPLYRPGSILGPVEEGLPINLEEVEHVIV